MPPFSIKEMESPRVTSCFSRIPPLSGSIWQSVKRIFSKPTNAYCPTKIAPLIMPQISLATGMYASFRHSKSLYETLKLSASQRKTFERILIKNPWLLLEIPSLLSVPAHRHLKRIAAFAKFLTPIQSNNQLVTLISWEFWKQISKDIPTRNCERCSTNGGRLLLCHT